MKKCILTEKLTYDNCKSCLFEGRTTYIDHILIENKKHEVYKINKHKAALNRGNV